MVMSNTNNNKMTDRLVFKPEFFEQEERNGFVVEPMMKNAWAANLMVLNTIDRICEEHNIPYFADWGTLLGAVRHRGYIPWDDDIDICMMRKDYLRFCEVVQQYKDEVALLNVYNADDWGEHADKVINIDSFTVKRSEIKEYYGFPFTAGVDIFLIDYVPRDKVLEEEQIEVLRTISQLIHIRKEMKEQIESKTERALVQKIKEMTNVEFSQPNPTDQELLILKEEVSGLYGDEDADYLSQLQLLGVGWDYYIPREVYEKAIRMPFENTTIPIPVGYDMLLRKKYGDNYMTPINQGAGHDYPFYKKAISEMAAEKNQDDEEVKQYALEIATDYYLRFVNKISQPRLSYGEDYFKAEVVDGKEVSEKEKRMRAAQIEVYLEVERLCREHELPLYAIGDTLAGAVTRKDFLPTSDGMYFAMKRPDYMRFLAVLQKELDPWFDYRNVYAYKEYEDMRCYIFADGYLCDEEEYRRRFHGCTDGVGIYISAIDSISMEASKEDVRKMLIENLLGTANSMPSQPPYSDEVMRIVEEWKRLLQVDIDTKNDLRREFVKAADNVAGGYRGECDKVRISSDIQKEIFDCYNKEWFNDIIEMDFSNVMIPVPAGYKKIMRMEKCEI